MKKILTIIAILALTMTGCVHPVGPREGTGTLLGAGAGALIGSQIGSGGGQIAAVALGTLAGALVGQDIGRTLDQTDQAYMRENAQSSLETIPSTRTGTWVNPDTGHSGSFTPTHTYRNASGQYCREYQQKVVIDGIEQQAYGDACRQPDASWIISTTTPESKGQVNQQHTTTRYVPASTYRTTYWPGYYPGYYYPGIFWPFTTISLSYGHFSGHRHYFRGGHNRHRGDWGRRGHSGRGGHGGRGRH